MVGMMKAEARPSEPVKPAVVDVAKAYLEFLYTPQGQTIAGKNYYRPRLPEVAEKFKNQFPQLKLGATVLTPASPTIS